MGMNGQAVTTRRDWSFCTNLPGREVEALELGIRCFLV